MNARIEASVDQIEDGAETIAAGARGGLLGLVDGARDRSRQAAAAVTRGKAPLSRLAGLGLGLSAVSHRTTDRVLKSQTALAAGQLDLLAERFDRAARAESLKDLVTGQIQLTPEQFSRLGRDAKAALAALVDGGSEARNVLRGSFGSDTPARKPARKKATSRSADPRRKTRKKASRKKASKKTATRRSTASKAD